MPCGPKCTTICGVEADLNATRVTKCLPTHHTVCLSPPHKASTVRPTVRPHHVQHQRPAVQIEATGRAVPTGPSSGGVKVEFDTSRIHQFCPRTTQVSCRLSMKPALSAPPPSCPTPTVSCLNQS